MGGGTHAEKRERGAEVIHQPGHERTACGALLQVCGSRGRAKKGDGKTEEKVDFRALHEVVDDTDEHSAGVKYDSEDFSWILNHGVYV